MPRAEHIRWGLIGIVIGTSGCDPSIGSDLCDDIAVQCADPRLPDSSVGPGIEYPEGRIPTRDLPRVSPAAEIDLTFPTPRYPSDSPRPALLAGNGRAGLFYVRTAVAGNALEVYRLDADGSIMEEARVPAPAIAKLPRDVSGHAKNVRWSYMRVVQHQGEAPILGINWKADCDSDDLACPVGEELIALQPELRKPPLRIFPARNNSRSEAVRTNDGGLWLFEMNALQKYDAAGKVSIRQPLLDHELPFSTRSGIDLPSPSPLISIGPNQDFYVWSYEETKSYASLWLFDERGNARWRIAPQTTDGRLISDRESRMVEVTTNHDGEIEIRRYHDALWRITSYVVQRDDYTVMYASSVTEDAAGNIYVLTKTGPRVGASPTVCKLPLQGALTCFLVPDLQGEGILGGEANVVYSGIYHRLDEQPPSEVELTLQRFEVP